MGGAPLEELTLPAHPALSESWGPAGQKVTRAQLCAGTEPRYKIPEMLPVQAVTEGL